MKAGRGIGVGILGTGFGVTTHYPAWSSIAGVQVMGFASRDAEHASRVSRELGLAITRGTPEALLTSPDVEIIVVAVPPAVQPAFIEAALEAGKHVFAEKPLAPDVQKASRLVGLAERNGLCHGVNFCLRQARASVLLKRVIAEGRIGKPWRVVVIWHRGHRAEKDLEWNWKCDASMGGGVMNALGVHILDLLMWLFSDVLHGCGVRQINIPRRRDPSGRERDVTGEDALSALLSLANKVTAFVSLDTTAIGGNGLRMDFYGDCGSLHVRQTTAEDVLGGFNVDISDRQGKTETLLYAHDLEEAGRVCLVGRMARDFVEAVRERKPFSPSFLDGLKVASACSRLQLVTGTSSLF